MADEAERDEATPAEPFISGHVPPLTRKRAKGDVMSEEQRAAMRKPRELNSYPQPGQSAFDKGVDMTGWTRQMKDLRRVKMTNDIKEKYVERLLVHGKRMIAAFEAGISYSAIGQHLKIDPDFQEDVNQALALRSQRISSRLEDEALEGHVQLTYDPKTGELTGEKTVYETPLRMAMMKRHDPEYKDKAEVDVNVRGGVLVVPGRLTKESWQKLFSPKVDPTQKTEAEE